MKIEKYPYPFPDSSFPFNIETNKVQSLNYRVSLHLHPFALEIQYIRSGTGNYFIKNRKYPFNGKSLFVMHGDDIHTFFPDKGISSIERTTITFSKTLFADCPLFESIVNCIAACHSKYPHKIHLNEDSATKIEFFADLLQKEWDEKKTCYKEAIINGLFQFLVQMKRSMAGNKLIPDSKTKHHKIIDKALKYIDSNYKKNLTLSSLSKHVCYSPFYVSHTLKELTGFTFQEHLANKRIMEAKHILESNNGEKIIEISAEVGFNDLSVFNRKFKSLTGMSPSKYRKFCISFRK